MAVAECGGGLHFAGSPVAALEFNETATRYVACPVRLDEIVVHQPTTTAQTVWVYDNWTSTTAATKVDTYSIPGTAGNYPLYGTGILSTRANDNADIINMPYFAIRTSTNAAVLNGLGCTVTVLYGK